MVRAAYCPLGTRRIYEDDEVKRVRIFDSIKRERDWTVQGHTQPPPPTDKPVSKAPVWDKK